MPRCSASALILASWLSGIRMVTRADLSSNSCETGSGCPQSYSDRSALAMNASTSSWVLSFGHGLSDVLIFLHLFLMHGSRADRAQIDPVRAFSIGIGHEDMATCHGRMRGVVALFIGVGVSDAEGRMLQHIRALVFRRAMFPAFRPIALIPLNASNFHEKNMYICQHKFNMNVVSIVLSDPGDGVNQLQKSDI